VQVLGEWGGRCPDNAHDTTKTGRHHPPQRWSKAPLPSLGGRSMSEQPDRIEQPPHGHHLADRVPPWLPSSGWRAWKYYCSHASISQILSAWQIHRYQSMSCTDEEELTQMDSSDTWETHWRAPKCTWVAGSVVGRGAQGVDVVVDTPCCRVCSHEVDDGAGTAKLETLAMKDPGG
jgi:hypothetical protein